MCSDAILNIDQTGNYIWEQKIEQFPGVQEVHILSRGYIARTSGKNYSLSTSDWGLIGLLKDLVLYNRLVTKATHSPIYTSD